MHRFHPSLWKIPAGGRAGLLSVDFGSSSDSQHSLTCPHFPFFCLFLPLPLVKTGHRICFVSKAKIALNIRVAAGGAPFCNRGLFHIVWNDEEVQRWTKAEWLLNGEAGLKIAAYLLQAL